MLTIADIRTEYPIHYHVWFRDCRLLDNLLRKNNQVNKEKRDTRGRSPLMLAVILKFVDIVKILLSHDCDINSENSDGWNVVQEAVATGDKNLLEVLLEKRQQQRHSSRSTSIPQLLRKLKDTPDFYVEMKWEFSSWMPLLTKMCPSDTYKVYKQGSSVRIDTTLTGFDLQIIQRGNRSFVFKGKDDLTATMLDIDHDQKQVYTEILHDISLSEMKTMVSTKEAISQRANVFLSTPIVNTFIEFEKIHFERCKSGILGFGNDKTEIINGYECKVFSATNVEIITKSRSDHLAKQIKNNGPSSESQQQQQPQQQSFLLSSSSNSLHLKNTLGIQSNQPLLNANDNLDEAINFSQKQNNCISVEDYFNGNQDVVVDVVLNTKIEKYKANLWLCENYPLSLPEQIMPIVDIMAISISHFAKLKDFIQMQLPVGFPIKIGTFFPIFELILTADVENICAEVPLFHVLTANITFENIFAMDAKVENISTVKEQNRVSCVVDQSCFEVPSSYSSSNYNLDVSSSNISRQFTIDDEDDILQFAIQQSVLDVGTENDQVDIWEALKTTKPSSRNASTAQLDRETKELQRAIEASLVSQFSSGSSSNANVDDSVLDEDIKKALLLSEQQHQSDEKMREDQEQHMLKLALELSIKEQ